MTHKTIAAFVIDNARKLLALAASEGGAREAMFPAYRVMLDAAVAKEPKGDVKKLAKVAKSMVAQDVAVLTKGKAELAEKSDRVLTVRWSEAGRAYKALREGNKLAVEFFGQFDATGKRTTNTMTANAFWTALTEKAEKVEGTTSESGESEGNGDAIVETTVDLKDAARRAVESLVKQGFALEDIAASFAEVVAELAAPAVAE